MSSVRILYHHRTRAEDAQGVHIQALIEAFRALGHRVDVVEPGPARRRRARDSRPAPAAKGQATDGAKSGVEDADATPTLAGRRIPHWLYEVLALAYNVPAALMLLLRCLPRRPDLIYERYALFSCAGLLVARWIRRPLVLEVNAPLSLELQEHGDLVLRAPAQRMEDWLCREATRTVVVSHSMAEIFAGRGVPREKLLVMPNGVDSRWFHPAVDGSSVRSRYGLEGCRVVGFVGWVRPWHGVDGLLTAMAGRLRGGATERVLIVGDGPAVPGLRRQARALGIEKAVIFTGAVAQDEVPAHLAALDIAVQPDVTSYASPIKLFEYLAIGRAVVAPDRPNIREVIEEGVSGLLFPPRDWEALGSVLAELLDDAEARHSLGEGAAARIEQGGYRWVDNARRVLEAVDDGNQRHVVAGA